MKWFPALLLAATMLSAAETVWAADAIKTNDAACAALKKAAAKLHDQSLAGPVSEWSCDAVMPQYQPNDYIVMRLNARPCRPNECVSNLLGWYAVRKKDGQVVEWDIGEDVPGKPI